MVEFTHSVHRHIRAIRRRPFNAHDLSCPFAEDRRTQHAANVCYVEQAEKASWDEAGHASGKIERFGGSLALGILACA